MRLVNGGWTSWSSEAFVWPWAFRWPTLSAAGSSSHPPQAPDQPRHGSPHLADQSCPSVSGIGGRTLERARHLPTTADDQDRRDGLTEPTAEGSSDVATPTEGTRSVVRPTSGPSAALGFSYGPPPALVHLRAVSGP